MGCYGIGVGRLAASICEAKHDDYGPIWPISIAPWEVEVCCLRVDDEETKKVSDEMYQKLTDAGVDVIYDDRDVRPGAMFSDADLIGAPIRVVVSPRNLKESCIELATRDKSYKEMVPVEEAFDAVATFVVLLSTIISHFTGLQIDGCCGLLVGLFILYAGISAAKDTINPLLGQPAEECFVEKVHEIVLSHKEILGMHDLVVHNYGPGRIMLSLHAEVPVDGSLAELHEVVDEVEHQLSDQLGCSAVIHMDPIWASDEESLTMKKEMEEDLKLMDPGLSLHDFRMVRCTGHIRLFFDIQEPYSCRIDEKELIERLQRHVKENHPGVELVICVDRTA